MLGKSLRESPQNCVQTQQPENTLFKKRNSFLSRKYQVSEELRGRRLGITVPEKLSVLSELLRIWDVLQK